MLLSALFHASWSAFMKRSPDTMAFNVLQNVPSLAVTLALLPFIELGAIPSQVWWILAGSGVIHGCYFLFLTRALEVGELSVVYPIIRSTPALTAIVAAPLLGEQLSPLGLLGIATVVAGVWLVQTGGGLRWRDFVAPGVGFAYLGLATTVGYSLTDKSMMRAFDAVPWHGPLPRSIVIYFLLSSLTLPTFLAAALRRTSPAALVRAARREWRQIGLASTISFLSYAAILEAFRHAEVSYVVAVRQCSVLFAVGIGVAWLGERPTPARVLGSGATVAGIALIAWGG